MSVSAVYTEDPRCALSIGKNPVLAWACPNIWLGQPGGTTAGPGQNTVGVRFTFQVDLVSEPFNAAAVDVFMFDPSMAPPTGFRPGGSGVYSLPSATVYRADFDATGGLGTVDLEIPPPVGSDPYHIVLPDSHRCLIARVYPNGTTKPGEFHLDDCHEAQRNIHIAKGTATSGGPTAAGAGVGEPGIGTPGGTALSPEHDWWVFLVNAWGSDDDAEREVAAVEVLVDVDVDFIWESMREVLQGLGIRRLQNLAADRIGLRVGDRLVTGKKEVGPSLTMTMTPRTHVPVGLLANLSRLKGRTAYAVHARQSLRQPDGQTFVERGGTTVLFYRADLTQG